MISFACVRLCVWLYSLCLYAGLGAWVHLKTCIYIWNLLRLSLVKFQMENLCTFGMAIDRTLTISEHSNKYFWRGHIGMFVRINCPVPCIGLNQSTSLVLWFLLLLDHLHTLSCLVSYSESFTSVPCFTCRCSTWQLSVKISNKFDRTKRPIPI